MARSGLRDPYTKYRWVVEIPDFSRLGFTACQVPAMNITPMTYAEGGQHWAPKSIPDKFEYTPIILSRGVTNDTSFNKWATASIDLYTSNNAVKNDNDTTFKATPSGIDPVSSPQYRKDIQIFQVNRTGKSEVCYFVYGAYVINYKPASDFDANADDGLSIETITLGYDSFEVKYNGLVGLLGSLAIAGINS
jgi:phage tail-like protein